MPDDVLEGQIKPEDIASQIMVVRTKDNQIAVQYPSGPPGDAPDVAEALFLYAAGLNALASMIRQQQAPEKPRISWRRLSPRSF